MTFPSNSDSKDLKFPHPSDESVIDRLRQQNGADVFAQIGVGAGPSVLDTAVPSSGSDAYEAGVVSASAGATAVSTEPHGGNCGNGDFALDSSSGSRIRPGLIKDIVLGATETFLGPPVLAGGHSDEEYCESRLDEQTNSFFVTPKCRSAPFVLALSITAFKIVVFVMAFTSVVGANPVAATDFFVSAAQFISIFISAMTQDDVTNGIKLFDEGYYALAAHFNAIQSPPAHETQGLVLNNSSPNGRPARVPQEEEAQPLGYVTKWKWAIAVITHLTEGGFGLTVTYKFIVQSSTVLDTLLNFAAVEFVSQLDNVFFELSAGGFMGEACFIEAQKIKHEVDGKYHVHGRNMPCACCFARQKKRMLEDGKQEGIHGPLCCGVTNRARNNLAKSWLRFLVFLCMLCPWIKLVVEQQRGINLPPNMVVQFGDQTIPSLPSFSGRYIRVKAQRPFRTNRFLWKNEAYDDRLSDNSAEGLGTFGYCPGLKRWTFSIQAENDPCQDPLVISSKAPKYDFWQTETLSWFVRSRRTFSLLESFSISPTCGIRREIKNDVDLDADINADLCRNDGECSSNTCICVSGLGRRCQWKKEDICSMLQVDERYGKLPASRELASVYELLTDESNDAEILLVYDHPIYVGQTTFHVGMDVILYTGLRWALVSSTDGFREKNSTNGYRDVNLMNRSDIYKFLQSPDFHPKTSIRNVDLVTTQVRIDSLDDKASPVELEWIKPLLVNETSSFDSLKLDAASISQANLICANCTSPDGKCLNTGVCNNQKCECNDGETGARCQKLPLGNGHCNPTFNSVSFRYDGGDCCKSTCQSGEFQCGFSTFKVDDIIHSFLSDFPYCLDTSVIGSCRGIVEEYGAGCWIRGCVGDSCWVDENGEPFQGLGIYQPTAEQVFLSRDGNVAIVLEQKGTKDGYSGLHLFTTVDSKYVHRSFVKSKLLGAAIYSDLGGTPSVYGLAREDEASTNHSIDVGLGWSFQTIGALDGDRRIQVLDAADGIVSQRLPNSAGIVRYKVLNGAISEKDSHYTYTAWVGSSGDVIFAQSQRRSHGVLAVSANTFQYLAVTNKTFDKNGNLVDLDFEPADTRTIENCSGIKSIAFFELESKANRLHVLCGSVQSGLTLFEYDLNFPNKTKETAFFPNEETSTYRFSADGSTLVFNDGSALRVYSNQTLWNEQTVRPAHNRPIDHFALSGDGSTIVTTSSSYVPQLFRVIPLRCSSPKMPMELQISVKVLFYNKPLNVRWSFADSGSDRLMMGSMNFTDSLEEEAQLCLPRNPRLYQMTLESLPLRRLPILPIVNENRFSFSVTLNGALCCSGFVDNFNKTECDFRRCIPGLPAGLPPATSESLTPSRQPDPTTPPTAPPTKFPSPSPSLAPTPIPTPAPSLPPTLSAHPTNRGATPTPTQGASDEPSLVPSLRPSRMPSLLPVIVTPKPSPLSSNQGCVWPDLSQCGNTFIRNNPDDRLEGVIPTTIGLWTQLTELSLSANDLSSTLPSEIGLLTNLRSLGVFGNNLRGTIPTELGQLTRVEQLWLDNNHFTGTIPSELGLLTSILKIDVQFNECTGTVPTELGRPKTLQGINLFGNALTGTIPSEICNAVTDKVLIDCDKVLCEPGCCRGRFGTTQC